MRKYLIFRNLYHSSTLKKITLENCYDSDKEVEIYPDWEITRNKEKIDKNHCDDEKKFLNEWNKRIFDL